MSLGKYERVEADDGYVGECMHVDLPHETRGSRSMKKKKKLVRSRHETVNRRLKQWEILKGVRHILEKLGDFFACVSVLTQLNIENGMPLFQVYY